MLPSRKMVIETYCSIEQVDSLKAMYYGAAAKVCIWPAIRPTPSLSSAWSAGTACTPTVTDWAVVRPFPSTLQTSRGLWATSLGQPSDLRSPSRPRGVHEMQQFKLSAVLHVVPLALSDDGGDRAPWRPDPRPHADLLQGTYAHLGVSEF